MDHVHPARRDLQTLPSIQLESTPFDLHARGARQHEEQLTGAVVNMPLLARLGR